MLQTDSGNRMNELGEKLVLYIGKTTGLSVRLTPFDAGKLPLYMKASDDFYTGAVDTAKVLFVVQKKNTEQTPADYQKKMELIAKAVPLPVVFVLETVTAYNRDRLIKNRVPFVVPGKQMYLPFLLIDLREMFAPGRMHDEKKLSPVSQCMALYHLLKQPLDGKTSRQIGELLSYSAMSVSRAVRELRAAGICREPEKTKDALRFIDDRKALWEKLRAAAQNPVAQVFAVSRLPNVVWKQSGESALAVYSDLNAPACPVYAISLEDAEKIGRKDRLPDIGAAETLPRIQLWKYPPALLSDGDAVDPLSLYLSMREEDDERIQVSLETMLNRMNLW